MEFLDPKKKKSPKFFDDNVDKKVKTIYDDPEWIDLRNKVKKQSEKDLKNNKKRPLLNDVQPPVEKKHVEVNIKLSLPSAHWDLLKKLRSKILNFKKDFSFDFLKNPKTYLIFCTVITVVAIASLVFISKNKVTPANVDTSKTTSQGKEEPVSHDTPFSPVTPPSGIDKNKISYNPERNFAKFDDSIDGIAVSVSQQTLPDNFKDDPETKLQELAKEFGQEYIDREQ